MIGLCALCHETAEIQKSHLIPQWAYRRVLESEPLPGSAPIYIANGNAVYSNRQTTRHTLCTDCEQRFSLREDYVSKLTELNDGKIRLMNKIQRMNTPEQVLAKLSNDVDAEMITYFAASVL